MEQSKVDMYLMANANKFKVEVIPTIKAKLLQMPDERFVILQSIELKDPTTMLLIAIFLGWERLFLEDIALGVLKILTCYGFGIWWLVDLFTVNDRTKDYNFRKFMSVM